MEEKFLCCDSCGNMVLMLNDSGVEPECCGEVMTLLEAKTVDMGREKHLPVVAPLSNHEIKVTVGEQPHPMVANHLIEFVCLQTTDGIVVRKLSAGNPPEAVFRFTGVPLAVYAYCNVHGLWKAEFKNICQGKETECKLISHKE